MQYAMLIYHPANAPAEQTEADHDRQCKGGFEWAKDLQAAGKVSTIVRLHPPATATTLREGSGRLLLTDGPFAETKEVLGGLVIFEVADVDEAIKLARTFPALANGGSVELRPVMAGGAGPHAEAP